MLTISFAALQDDVVIYSDLIKVKVALDDTTFAFGQGKN